MAASKPRLSKLVHHQCRAVGKSGNQDEQVVIRVEEYLIDTKSVEN